MTARNRLLAQSGLILVVLTLLIVIACIFQKVVPVPQPVPPVSSDTHYLYAPGNVQFDIAPGWVLATDTVALPKDISGLRFAFLKQGTPCVFAYVRMTSAEREAYVQTSFAERIFSGPNDANQFDSSWYIRKTDTPAGFAFDWDARQPFRNEVRIMPPGYLGRWEYGDHMRAFLLYDEDGTTVPDECNADVNSMLHTLVEYYPTTTLSRDAVGSLYIKYSKVLLLGDDDIARLVYELPAGASDFMFARNRIYYRAGSSVRFYDLLQMADGVTGVRPLATDANYSYLVSGASIFSISDGSCAPDVPCKQKLYDMDIGTGLSSFLGDVSANSIMGFSTKDQAVYLEWAHGDAGCASSAVTRYSIIRGVMEDVGNFSSCQEDTGYAAKMAAYKAVRDSLDGGMRSGTHIDVAHGLFTIPSNDTFADPGAFPLRFE
ncbi:MAG: hypothetical protein JWM46_890 [Candidatus Kaiserbacteria bacterium]|nr:hypothetical protein [Candidatus Kaiserbacteria bacterium]